MRRLLQLFQQRFVPLDKTIAKNWAMRKMYHLIGQLEYNKDNQATLAEIKELAKKFGLKIPAYKAK